MVICLERGADLHTAQLMPLPLTFLLTKIQIGFTFLVPAHLSSPGKRAVKRVCKRVCVCLDDDLARHFVRGRLFLLLCPVLLIPSYSCSSAPAFPLSCSFDSASLIFPFCSFVCLLIKFILQKYTHIVS